MASPREPNGRTDGTAELDYLSSWKEIATLLQISVKTAQRWEAERGLPVKRIGGRVSISREALANWRRESGVDRPWWQQVRALQIIAGCAAASALFLGIYVAYLVIVNRFGTPVSARWVGSDLVASDALGRTRSLYRSAIQIFEHFPSMAEFYPRTIDINGDGRPEILSIPTHNLRDAKGWDLLCVDESGGVQWTLKVTESVTAGGKLYTPPYVLRSYVVFDAPTGDGKKWIAATFAHRFASPSVLMVADSAGKILGSYWHAGHLDQLAVMDIENDGSLEIVAGGIDHAVNQATLVAFDPRAVSGASQTPPDHEMHYAGKPAGSEKYRAHFARTKLNLKFDNFNFVSKFDQPAGGLDVTTREHLAPPVGYVVYSLDQNLRVREVYASQATDEAARMRTVSEGKDAAEFELTKAELDRLKREYKLTRLRQ